MPSCIALSSHLLPHVVDHRDDNKREKREGLACPWRAVHAMLDSRPFPHRKRKIRSRPLDDNSLRTNLPPPRLPSSKPELP
jgi:hypothetical protein